MIKDNCVETIMLLIAIVSTILQIVQVLVTINKEPNLTPKD